MPKYNKISIYNSIAERAVEILTNIAENIENNTVICVGVDVVDDCYKLIEKINSSEICNFSFLETLYNDFENVLGWLTDRNRKAQPYTNDIRKLLKVIDKIQIEIDKLKMRYYV